MSQSQKPEGVPGSESLIDSIQRQNAQAIEQDHRDAMDELGKKFPGLEGILESTSASVHDLLKGFAFFDTLQPRDAELLAATHTGPLTLTVSHLSEEALRALQKHKGVITIKGVEYFRYIKEENLPPDGAPIDLDAVKAEVARQTNNPTFKSSTNSSVSNETLRLLDASSLVTPVVTGNIQKNYAGSLAAQTVYRNFQVLAA